MSQSTGGGTETAFVASVIASVTVATGHDPYPSGMIDLDNGAWHKAVHQKIVARDAPANFMIALGGNDNRYTGAECTPAGCRLVKACAYGNLGGIPIPESDVLIIDRGISCTDGFGVAGLVVVVTRRSVFGGDGKVSRGVGN